MKHLILFMLLSSCITIEELTLEIPSPQVQAIKDYGSNIQAGKWTKNNRWCAYDVFGELGPNCYPDQAACEHDTTTFDGCGLK